MNRAPRSVVVLLVVTAATACSAPLAIVELTTKRCNALTGEASAFFEPLAKNDAGHAVTATLTPGTTVNQCTLSAAQAGLPRVSVFVTPHSSGAETYEDYVAPSGGVGWKRIDADGWAFAARHTSETRVQQDFVHVDAADNELMCRVVTAADSDVPPDDDVHELCNDIRAALS